jgi:hypothetical protein
VKHSKHYICYSLRTGDDWPDWPTDFFYDVFWGRVGETVISPTLFQNMAAFVFIKKAAEFFD